MTASKGANLKTCSRCKRDKSLSEFYISRTNSSGFQSRCKDCDKEKRKIAYWSDLEGQKAISKKWRDKDDNRKRSHLKSRYGISLEEYESLLKNQNYCCAICQKESKELEKSLSVDHCHRTGSIRGLLCLDCNFCIAHAKDSIEILLSSIKYLEKNGYS